MLQEIRFKNSCAHCGEACSRKIKNSPNVFCCEGCMQIFYMLNQSVDCDTGSIKLLEGIEPKGRFIKDKWSFLDDPLIAESLISFSDNKHTHINFKLPQIHCSSCIWILEHLNRINKFVASSKVDFEKKEVNIIYEKHSIKLSQIAQLLGYIGYGPSLHFSDKLKRTDPATTKREILRIGVAGFCFSNIMMLSFPDYLAADGIEETVLKNAFNYISLLLAIPVILYAAAPFFIQAWKGIRQKWLNIDSPIAFAILITFSRSIYEILLDKGTGYLDSMSGIVFFMLLGRWFQLKTQNAVSFDRDYKSYFPMSTIVINNNEKKYKTIDKIEKNDIIIIRNQELIPADSILKKGNALIDYSFVTGENEPVEIKKDELIYAGGKQIGTSIELQVIRPVSTSHLTRLWDNDVFHHSKKRQDSFIHPWSNYFSFVLLCIGVITAIFWEINDPSKTWKAVTSILIVACPCSLLLSATFTYGNLMRIFRKNNFTLKNANIIEQLGKADTIVFDKTGTLTTGRKSDIEFRGKTLSHYELILIKTLAAQSNHPLSKALTNWSSWSNIIESNLIEKYHEYPGKGIEATINGSSIKMGHNSFIHLPPDSLSIHDIEGTEIHLSINNIYKGVFSIEQEYREGVFDTLSNIKNQMKELHILSGDNNIQEETIRKKVGNESSLSFNKSPQEKLEYIKSLQEQGKTVIMVGDGLNDSGALQQSDIGIAVSENSTSFTPASDAIVGGNQIINLHRFLRLSKLGKKIVTISFVLSIAYNLIGLGFATKGLLSPMIAAILMPASSISILLLVTFLGNFYAKRLGVIT